MADRVDEFLFRGFIPEENRGGTYHVTLNLGGRLVGPMTPQQSDAQGWPLPAIMADINRQALAELSSCMAMLQESEARIGSLSAELAAERAKTKAAEAATLETAAQPRSILSRMNPFGMFKKE